MKKTLFVIALLSLAVAAPSWAKDVKGLYGLGYFRSEFPIGGRAWITDKVGADLGIGFSILSSDNPGNPGAEGKATSYGVDLGVPFIVHGTDNALFFVRPGFSFASSPNPVLGGLDNRATSMWVSGSLGVEYFFTDHFSIQAAHGVAYKSVSPGSKAKDLGAKSYSSIGSEAFGISDIGFHYYFGAK
jgi:hypothetical protein